MTAAAWLLRIGFLATHVYALLCQGETKVSKLAKLGSSPVDYSEIQAENLRSLFVASKSTGRQHHHCDFILSTVRVATIMCC